MSEMTAKKATLLPLTGMRFVLALWVVIFHQPFFNGLQWLSRFPLPLPILLRTGFLAVGVFFVLSGFVLSYNYALEEWWSLESVTKFGAARFARIYPAYCTGLLLAAPFVAASLIRQWPSVRWGKALIIAGLNWTLLQAWLPTLDGSWNYPGWSLSAEAFFYCCFPLLGVALWRLSSLSSLLISGLLLCIGALIVPLLVVALPLANPIPLTLAIHPAYKDAFWFNVITFNPLLRLPQFGLGIILGRAYQLLRARNSMLLGHGYWLYIPGILLEIVAIAGCYAYGVSVLLLDSGLLMPFHALVILGMALGGGTLAHALSFRPLVFLGNASYGLYILHVPLAMWMAAISERLFSQRPDGFGAMAVYILLVVGVSAIFFKFVEEPANLILKKRLKPLLANLSRQRHPIPGQVAFELPQPQL